MLTTIEQLIQRGVLLKAYDYESIEDGCVSYTIHPDYVLTTKSQTNRCDNRINYVQLIREQDGDVWVLQLEATPEDPNNVQPNGTCDINIYKLVV